MNSLEQRCQVLWHAKDLTMRHIIVRFSALQIIARRRNAVKSYIFSKLLSYAIYHYRCRLLLVLSPSSWLLRVCVEIETIRVSHTYHVCISFRWANKTCIHENMIHNSYSYVSVHKHITSITFSIWPPFEFFKSINDWKPKQKHICFDETCSRHHLHTSWREPLVRCACVTFWYIHDLPNGTRQDFHKYDWLDCIRWKLVWISERCCHQNRHLLFKMEHANAWIPSNARCLS